MRDSLKIDLDCKGHTDKFWGLQGSREVYGGEQDVSSLGPSSRKCHMGSWWSSCVSEICVGVSF